MCLKHPQSFSLTDGAGRPYPLAESKQPKIQAVEAALAELRAEIAKQTLFPASDIATPTATTVFKHKTDAEEPSLSAGCTPTCLSGAGRPYPLAEIKAEMPEYSVQAAVALFLLEHPVDHLNPEDQRPATAEKVEYLLRKKVSKETIRKAFSQLDLESELADYLSSEIPVPQLKNLSRSPPKEEQQAKPAETVVNNISNATIPKLAETLVPEKPGNASSSVGHLFYCPQDIGHQDDKLGAQKHSVPARLTDLQNRVKSTTTNNNSMVAHLPALLDQLIGRRGGKLDPPTVQTLQDLKAEIMNGSCIRSSSSFIHTLEKMKEEELLAGRDQWCGPSGVRLMFAEAYFYHLVLSITGYFEAGGALHKVDPFEFLKAKELALPETWASLESALSIIIMPTELFTSKVMQLLKLNLQQSLHGEDAAAKSAAVAGLNKELVDSDNASTEAPVKNSRSSRGLRQALAFETIVAKAPLSRLSVAKHHHQPKPIKHSNGPSYIDMRLRVDHSSEVASKIDAQCSLVDQGCKTPFSVSFICGNAGQEMLHDLLLVDTLLARKIKNVPDALKMRRHVICKCTLHLPEHPTFCSHATSSDVSKHLGQLCAGGVNKTPAVRALGERLQTYYAEGRLILKPNTFWCHGTSLTVLPKTLQASFKNDFIVFIKGDTNYRRLLRDSTEWLPDASIADVSAGFPDPIVGLPAGMAEKLGRQDLGWRRKGGIIQTRDIVGES